MVIIIQILEKETFGKSMCMGLSQMLTIDITIKFKFSLSYNNLLKNLFEDSVEAYLCVFRDYQE